jgi:hypothetical protein
MLAEKIDGLTICPNQIFSLVVDVKQVSQGQTNLKDQKKF